MLIAPANRSVPDPFGSAANSRLYVPCCTPHPPSPGSPQLVMPLSGIELHAVVAPFRVCHTPPSCSPPVESSATTHAYISLRPGTTASSARYIGHTGVAALVAGQLAVVSPAPG